MGVYISIVKEIFLKHWKLVRVGLVDMDDDKWPAVCPGFWSIIDL